MKVVKVISKSPNEKRMEVIAKEGDTQKTLHICQEHVVWKYFVDHNKNGKKVFSPITV